MSSGDIQTVITDLNDHVRRAVAAGFSSEQEIREGAIEAFADQADPAQLVPHAELATREAVVAHRRAEADWPEETDCDRLDRVFEDLERSGIVARQNFACCGSCGSAEIFDEIDAVRQQGLEVRGYTFYHMQDTDHAVDGAGLYLGYGAVENDPAAALEIANEIVDRLARYGFQTEWNGTVKTRIHVALEWRKRWDD